MDVDTSAENVARRIEALRRASSRFDILDCEAALQVADLAEALFAQIQRRDETMDRLLAQATAQAADADAARRSAARNFERAEAQSRLVKDLNADCTKLMAALHHETMLREDLEASAALLSETDGDDQPDEDWKQDLSLMQYNDLKGKP